MDCFVSNDLFGGMTMLQRRYGLVILGLVIGLALAACGGSGASGDQPTYSADLIAEGQTYYQQTCSACHGPEGLGIDNLGKNIVTSEFVRDQSDAELMTYVKTGRAVDDPLNTTGIAMPPKGGNPALTDDQIDAIIAYMRSIQQ
jgi:disulfide bond formation protein DsbB